jgi:LysM repeat protein
MQITNLTLHSLILAALLLTYIATHSQTAYAQAHNNDLAVREEIEAARIRLLKAIDEIENMKLSDESQRIQLESLYKEISQIKEENKRLRADIKEQQALIQRLQANIEKSEKSLNAQREVLINEISRLSVETKKTPPKASKSKTPPTKIHEENEEDPLPDLSKPSNEKRGREYYVHEVKKGQTLFSIVQAYRQEGATDATLEEVLEENNLRKTDVLVSGQKIYIPKSTTKR